VFVLVRKISTSAVVLEATKIRRNKVGVHLLPSGGVDKLYHASGAGFNERAA
jgi:hypothetical protein